MKESVPKNEGKDDRLIMESGDGRISYFLKTKESEDKINEFVEGIKNGTFKYASKHELVVSRWSDANEFMRYFDHDLMFRVYRKLTPAGKSPHPELYSGNPEEVPQLGDSLIFLSGDNIIRLCHGREGEKSWNAFRDYLIDMAWIEGHKNNYSNE